MRLIYATPRHKVRSRDVDVREQNFRAIRLIRFILYRFRIISAIISCILLSITLPFTFGIFINVFHTFLLQMGSDIFTLFVLVRISHPLVYIHPNIVIYLRTQLENLC